MSFYSKEDVDKIINQLKLENEIKIIESQKNMEIQMLNLIKTNFPNFESNPFTILKGLDFVKISRELNSMKKECQKLQEQIDYLKVKVYQNGQENDKLEEELKVEISDNEKENEELQKKIDELKKSITNNNK